MALQEKLDSIDMPGFELSVRIGPDMHNGYKGQLLVDSVYRRGSPDGELVKEPASVGALESSYRFLICDEIPDSNFSVYRRSYGIIMALVSSPRCFFSSSAQGVEQNMDDYLAGIFSRIDDRIKS
jgi:hypothetical protein